MEKRIMKIQDTESIKHRWKITAAIITLPFLLMLASSAMALKSSEDDFKLKLLGKYIFFDDISDPRVQSCASCHAPKSGWTAESSNVNKKTVVVPGAQETFGTLKPPSSAYASFSPNFNCSGEGGNVNEAPFICEGGNFWDGRAEGNEVADLNILGGGLDRYTKYLGAIADQAHASPFTNPVEQAVVNITEVCEMIKSAPYAPLYEMAYDNAPIDCSANEVETTFGRIALALSAYQASDEVNAFDSKRDRALAEDFTFPLDGFTDQENLGHALFHTTNLNNNTSGPRGANCSGCHSNKEPESNGEAPDELFTNMQYQTIGTPRNIKIPDNPEPNIGLGRLETIVGIPVNGAMNGFHKTPTMRNVDKRPIRTNEFVKAYGHNGWFKSLESIVHFYNTRDAKPVCDDPVASEKKALRKNCWPPAEFPDTIVPNGVMGNLNLTAEEEAAIVAYLKTLSDIPTPKKPKPYHLRNF